MFGGKAKLMGVLGAISMELHFSHGANLNLAVIRAKMVRFCGVVIHNPKTHIRVKLQRKLGLATNCMQWLTRSASIGRLLGYKSIKAVPLVSLLLLFMSGRWFTKPHRKHLRLSQISMKLPVLRKSALKFFWKQKAKWISYAV